jgi:hypothetical protein
MGGQLYLCQKCREFLYSYHSCKNRHCPKCQNHQAQEWLEKQKELLLPINYFLLTFTLPQELRAVARSHQETIYNILFRSSAEALQQLAWDKRFVGGRIGMVGVLHTWTRALLYHPHVHYIVTGGGLDESGNWVSSRPDFLVHVFPLGVLFRAKVREELKKTNFFDQVSERVWKKSWVVHCEAVGSGEAAFKYLAPYIFRVAISNRRILELESGKVTFEYKESATDQKRITTVTAEEFIRRFLQHVLPERFIKVRYYGLLSPTNRHLLNRAREVLTAGVEQSKPIDKSRDAKQPTETKVRCCPKCGSSLILVESLKPQGRSPP